MIGFWERNQKKLFFLALCYESDVNVEITRLKQNNCQEKVGDFVVTL